MSSKSFVADQFAQKWTGNDSTCVIEIFVVNHWAYLILVLFEEAVPNVYVGIDAGGECGGERKSR